MKNITNEQAINYLVDVIGENERDACQDISRYGIEGILNDKQVKECIKYNK